jgi:hypothetical protein
MSPDTPPSSAKARSAAPAQAPPTAPRTVADLLAWVVFARDLEQLPPTPPTWLWHGYLGRAR